MSEDSEQHEKESSGATVVEPRLGAHAELLVRYREGDQTAFVDLISMYRSKVYTYIVRSGVNQAQRDDVFQEIFLSIHRNARRYDETLPLSPWVFTIVVNTVRSYFRRNRRDRLELDDRIAEMPSQTSKADDISAAKETAEWLEGELLKLTESEKEAFLLCGIKELSQDEVSSILSIPVNTVKTHLRRARLRLAKAVLRRDARIKEEVLS